MKIGRREIIRRKKRKKRMEAREGDDREDEGRGKG